MEAIKLYRTKNEAYQDAKRREEVGLTGSGQRCETQPIKGTDGQGYTKGWIYKTWDNRHLTPEGEITEEEVKNLLAEQYKIILKEDES